MLQICRLKIMFESFAEFLNKKKQKKVEKRHICVKENVSIKGDQKACKDKTDQKLIYHNT